MSDHTRSLSELLKSYNVDIATGRTSRQAAAALDNYGENRLPPVSRRRIPALRRLLPQMMGAPLFVLLAAAVMSFAVSLRSGSGGYREPIIITLLAIVNGVINILPEYRAEKALDSLGGLAAPSAAVLRDGEVARVPTERVVPGDIMLLEAGDLIPADGRLLEAASFKCDEGVFLSPGDGGDVPADWPYKSPGYRVRKDAPITERHNMVYAGATVIQGRAKAIVTATGAYTEAAALPREPERRDGYFDEPTPMQQKLTRLGRGLSLLTLIICGIILVLGLLRQMELQALIMAVLSLAVAALPAGLSAAVTVILALNARIMLRHNVLAQNHAAIEALGATSVICSDKTGTLTGEKLSVAKVWIPGGGVYNLNGNDRLPEKARHILRLAALCSNEVSAQGGVTEDAVLEAAAGQGMEKRLLDREFPRAAELPFDSRRKLMTTVHNVGGRLIAITKGSCDALLPLCKAAGSSGAAGMNLRMTQGALKVLAVACRSLDKMPTAGEITPERLEKNLVLMGLLGMSEPPREETKRALARCRAAGIKTVMVTGDNLETAAAAAMALGIIQDESQAVTGAQIAAMQDWELEDRVNDYGVYAGVSPDDRLRIVSAWQQSGEVVAATGDSVADVPSLLAADIGCAMGAGGSDAARRAAGMVLLDNSFSSLAKAVETGRVVSANIKKAVRYLLGANVAELLAVLLAMLFGWELPLLAVHLLLVNAIAGVFPAMALGLERPEGSIMRRPPLPRDESIFARGLGAAVMLQGLMLGMLTLTAYFIGCYAELSRAVPPSWGAGVTMAFLVLAGSQLVQAFNCKSEGSLFRRRRLFANRALNLAALASLLFILVISLSPTLSGLFSLTGISMYHWGVAAVLALMPLPIHEIAKALGRRRRRVI